MTTNPNFFRTVADLAEIASRAAAAEANGRRELMQSPQVSDLAARPAAPGPDIFFNVRKEPIELHPAPSGRTLGIGAWMATVRDTPNGPMALGMVTPTYELVMMRDVVDQAEAAFREALGENLFGRTRVKDRIAYGGAKVYRSYTVPTGLEVPHHRSARIAGTKVAFMLNVINGYDGDSPVSCASGTLDLLCTNGMIGFVAGKTVKKRHTKNAATMDWGQVCREAFEHYRKDVEKAREWAQRTMTTAEARQRLERLGLGPQALQALVGQFEREAENRGGTAWALASAITFNATHAGFRDTGADHTAATLVQRQSDAARMIARVLA